MERRSGVDRAEWAVEPPLARGQVGRSVIFAAALVVVACGCGSSADGPTGVLTDSGAAGGAGRGIADGDDPALSEGFVVELTDYDGPIEVSCGSMTFDGRSIALDDYPIFTDDLATYVPANFREEFELERQEGQLDIVFHEIERDDSRIHLLGPVPGDADGSGRYFKEIAFDLVDGEWRLDRWGGCRPMVDIDGFGISELRLDPSNEPTSSTQTLALLVTERACASGRLPEGRAVAPIVFESPGAVDVLVLVEESRGDVDCPGNPSFPLEVELDVPLGDRTIHNIAFEPPVALTWPIPQRSAELSLVVAGDPPSSGTANAFAWTGSHAGTILLEPNAWNDFAGWVQSWSPANEPRTISGFVASCGAGGCEEECEGDACIASNQILGEVCSADYIVTEGFDSTITITYADQTCTINQTLTAIE